MNKEFSFQLPLDLFSDDQCNISEHEASEGSETQQANMLPVEVDTHCNSLSKFGKLNGLREIKKFKSQLSPTDKDLRKIANDDNIGQEIDKNQRKLSYCLCRPSNDCQRLLLKDEVSMLLRALIDSKKDRKMSDSTTLACFAKENSSFAQQNKEFIGEFVTMKDIEPILN